MYIERILSSKLKELTSHFPAVVVSGARQVGKSTLVKKLFEKGGDYVLFDPVVDVENAKQDPDLFLNNHRRRPLILDEIQYVPELVPVLKRAIDQDRSPGQFIVTGSQQWEVMKRLSESMAGRAVFLDLAGFSLSEVSGSPPLRSWLQRFLEEPKRFLGTGATRLPLDKTSNELLWRGFLPEAVSLPLELVPDFHEAYFRTYVERDVRQLTDVADWQRFGRFVRLAAALTAQEINYSQFGREIGITPQTAGRWLATMRATFQWFEVAAYSGNTVKRISGKPKGYIADTGFASTLQAISRPNAIAAHPLQGSLFETAVVAELKKLASAMSPKPNFYHWRTSAGAEVDVILERDGVYFPIEIKYKSRPARRDTRGISAFRQTYPHLNIGQGLVVAPAEKITQISDHDYTLPWDTE